jgi:molybdate-binding protein
VADLARSDLRLVNRENGAALRVLLDDRLAAAGIPAAQISGYHREVGDHIEGAQRVACGIADAALGLRAIAEAFDLGFLPLATARCDLVIPEDLCEHPVVQILLDTLQTRRLCRELAALPGYDASVTGKAIARL